MQSLQMHFLGLSGAGNATWCVPWGLWKETIKWEDEYESSLLTVMLKAGTNWDASLRLFPMWKMRLLTGISSTYQGYETQAHVSPHLEESFQPCVFTQGPSGGYCFFWGFTDAGTRAQSHQAGSEESVRAPVPVAQAPGRAGLQQSLEGLCPQTQRAGKIGSPWGGLELRSLSIKYLPLLLSSRT